MRYEYLLLLASAVLATPLKPRQEQAPENVQIPSPIAHTSDLTACQGYRLTGADERDDGIDGTLELIGNCTAYGPDYPTLNLTVRYETADRLRVQIRDVEGKAHVVPDDVASWPKVGENNVGKEQSKLEFQWQSEPFSFKIVKKDTGEVIFDTTGQAIVFEEQYLRIQSALSAGSNIQGLGQHNDNFTLPIDRDNYVRTLWTRDAYGVPSYTNLYGAHPIFVNQKVGQNASASGVYLLNSNGMDVKFPNGTAIEYNVLGGIIDLFFLNGPTPADVARQGAQIWGTSSEVPYWSLGFHSCKYGYIDIAEVAEVVANYTAAGIPVQTQWMVSFSARLELTRH
jgi:alpha-glucosidase